MQYLASLGSSHAVGCIARRPRFPASGRTDHGKPRHTPINRKAMASELAVTDGAVHVEHDEVENWIKGAEQHGLHGVKTNYVGPNTYEVLLFDQSKIAQHSSD